MTPDSADFQDFLNHLTNNALESLKHADAIARSFGSAYVGTEHLLLGILAQDGSMGAKILEGAGVTLDRARIALNLTPKTMVLNAGAKGLSETAKLTWSGMALLGYDFERKLFNKQITIYGGYRGLGIDKEDGNGRDKNAVDVKMQGALLGIEMKW